MNFIKKAMAILLVLCLSIVILSGSVNAASTTIRASASKVNNGKTVSVTVSFGENVSAAQFALNFDESKFTYVSCSLNDSYSKDSKYFAWVSGSGTASLSSVTFTFKAKALGSGTFSISGLKTSNRSNTISKSSVSVTVQKATTTTTKPQTTPTPTPTEDPNQNQVQEDINKYELYDVKSKLLELTETDYTEKSWGDLQDAITKAENAMTNAEYDEVKSMLTINNLEVEKFEKTELNSLLVALIGKAENKYTEESWKELQDAIDLANKAELQSEYDEIKDKLTIDTLVEKEGGFQGIVNFFQGLDEQERISLALGVCVAILFIIIIILWRLYSKEKDRMRYDARRH